MDVSWKPLSRPVWIVYLVVSLLFVLYAALNNNNFLFLDYVNLPFHEFGHLLFCFFGEFVCLLGGTITQVLIPACLCVLFVTRGDIGGTAFCGLWTGESLINVSVYIADARRMALPLVGGGEHDWNGILGTLHLLAHDTTIAIIVKLFGWLVIAVAVLWLAYMGLRDAPESC